MSKFWSQAEREDFEERLEWWLEEYAPCNLVVHWDGLTEAGGLRVEYGQSVAPVPAPPAPQAQAIAAGLAGTDGRVRCDCAACQVTRWNRA